MTTLGLIAVALGTILLILGGLLLVFAAYGVLVLPDALTRQHAATKAGTLALALICLGAVLVSRDAGWTVRLLAIVAFLTATLPVASHLLARAAATEGGNDHRFRQAPLIGGGAAEATPPRSPAV
jgi:multicomponent Na+:H+ antiporter subunit G